MKSGIMQWVSHSNMPILSVDVQPNGFRFVTGGSDHKVCIWNLLPAISTRYERGLPPASDHPIDKRFRESALLTHKSNGQNEDEEMKAPSEQDEDGTADSDQLWKERDEAMLYEDEDGYEQDIGLMEGLFDNSQKRYQKKLAVLENHASPVNCVRWNNIGTLFASAADDGSIILWEYVGEMVVSSAFQKFQYNTSVDTGFSQMRMGAVPEESKTGEPEKVEPDQIYEEWRMKRTFTSHKGGVSDLAWSPDNIHFASCSTDSQLIIWSINEQGPIRIIEAKANGITFDPFGKFMATQSSEDRSLTIWRIQQNFKHITQECVHSSYYKQSMSMSMFRRLSWSADGQFISTTAGRAGGMHTAPLIERSSWRLAATLAGHNKPITSSRINPRLYREQSDSGLSAYSIVAIASIDSTITVWKPSMERPLTVMMDIFKMGISDLSWGFNGNILLASAHDGKVVCIHYMPGKLGQPVTELEKQLIIEKKYGTTVLNDYKSHTKLQNLNLGLIGHGVVHNQQQQNHTVDQLKEQQKETVKVNGKKKIVPVMVREFAGENQSINPFVNPFHNQMLRDDTASTAQLTVPSQIVDQQMQSNQSEFNSTLNVVVQGSSHPNKPLISLVDSSPNTSIEAANKQRVETVLQQDPREEEKKDEAMQGVDNSGKKTKKSKKKVEAIQPPASLPALPEQKLIQQQSFVQNQVQSMQQVQQLGIKSSISQYTYQQAAKEQIIQLERILQDQSQQSQTIMSLDEYQSLSSIAGKEEMQLILPARDIYSDEIRVLITNMDGSGTSNMFLKRKCAQIRIYSGAENAEVSQQQIDNEFIVITAASSSFYILYTSGGKLNVYSGRTTQLIRGGLILEGVCFIDINENCLAFATLSLKGNICVYRVKNLESASGMQSMIDAVSLDWQASVSDLIRARSQSAQLIEQPTRSNLSVKYIKLVSEGSLIVFLSDNSVFEYEVAAKGWRQTLLKGNTSPLQGPSNEVKSVHGGGHAQFGQLKDLSQIINQLETQNLDMEGGDYIRPNPYENQTLLTRVNELQEQLQVYERLHLKNEFLYTLRMYTMALLQTGDMLRLKELMGNDYKFMFSWEDERMMDVSKNNYRVTQEGALANLMGLVATSQLSEGGHTSEDQVGLEQAQNKGRGGIHVDKAQMLMVCGGIEKKLVFQQAVLPVIKSMCAQSGCADLRDYISSLVTVMFQSSEARQHSNTQQAVHQQQLIQQQQMQQQMQQYQQEQQLIMQQQQQFIPAMMIQPQLPSIQDVFSAALRSQQQQFQVGFNQYQ